MEHKFSNYYSIFLFYYTCGTDWHERKIYAKNESTALRISTAVNFNLQGNNGSPSGWRRKSLLQRWCLGGAGPALARSGAPRLRPEWPPLPPHPSHRRSSRPNSE